MKDLLGAPVAQDISVELYRTYVYKDGGEYRINEPNELYIVESGGHRVVDANGVTHAPARPWVAIKWEQSNSRPFEF